MSDMSWEHASEARAALNAIVTDPEHGVAALSNPQTMSNLLKDYLPDAPREKSILVAAAEAGLADTLRDHVGQGMDPNTAIRLTASSFSSSTPFTPEACNWVTDEIAVALGISQPRQPGSGQAGGGGAGGAQFGAGAAGSQGMPTRIVPIPGAAGAPAAAGAAGAPGAPGGFQQAQPANQAPGQGYPQAPAQGFGAPGQPGPQDQAPGQGYRPGYAPGPQPGGFARPQGQGYPGQPPQPQPQPYQAQRFPGQPAAPYPGQQQPQPYQPGRGYPGQPGFVQPGQPGQPGAPAGWGPAVGYGPGGGPPKPSGGRRGLLVAGGIIVLIIIVIVAAVVLNKKPHKNSQAGGGGSPSASASAPSTSPTSSPTQSGGVEPLSTIMNPAGLSPVGTECGQPVLNGLKASTLIASTFCRKTTFKNVQVWGYQFDSHADYLAGVAHINSFTGFKRTSVNTTCNPPVEGTDGLSPWHANANPKYVARSGQILECFVDNGYPLVIWTMPTMNVFFIGRDYSKADQITRLVTWWTKVNYG